MTSYVMESGLHASGATLKEKSPSDAVYFSRSHVAASSTRANKKNQSRSPRLSNPELSVVSEDGQVVLGIDVHTGLPKLAVELLPEMEEVRPMGHRISTCSDSSGNSAPGQSRRKVSFDPTSDIKRQRSMSDSKVSVRGRHALAWLCTCLRKMERERKIGEEVP